MWSFNSNFSIYSSSQPVKKEGFTNRIPMQNITNRNSYFGAPERMYPQMQQMERPAVNFQFQAADTIDEDIMYMQSYNNSNANNDIDW